MSFAAGQQLLPLLLVVVGSALPVLRPGSWADRPAALDAAVPAGSRP